MDFYHMIMANNLIKFKDYKDKIVALIFKFQVLSQWDIILFIIIMIMVFKPIFYQVVMVVFEFIMIELFIQVKD